MSAVSGLNVGAENAMNMTKKKNLPRIIFINQMDRENANYLKVLTQLEEKYGTSIAPIQYPIMENGVMTGYVDVASNESYKFNGKNIEKTAKKAFLKSKFFNFFKILVVICELQTNGF